LVAEHLQSWELTPDGPPWYGQCALVLPVRRRGGSLAALKVAWPHWEARYEHLALQLWAGRGAVRLLAAAPASWCLLLERLDAGRPLAAVDLLEACEVLGGLFGQLDRPAPAQLDTLAERGTRWQGQLAAGSPLVPRRLTQQARFVLVDLLADLPAPRLVHEDLHDANVLAPLDPARGRWLAIDPKPVAGEWAYAVAPMVWNRPDQAAAAHSLRAHVRLRAEIIADAAGLDPERVRLWTFTRLTLNAVWAAEGAPASDGFRARMIALAKAFAD
jgi:streptomycin 6-kinase